MEEERDVRRTPRVISAAAVPLPGAAGSVSGAVPITAEVTMQRAAMPSLMAFLAVATAKGNV